MIFSGTVCSLLFVYLYVVYDMIVHFYVSVVPSAVPSSEKLFCNELIINTLQGNSVVPSAVPSAVPPTEGEVCKTLNNRTL